MACVDSSSAVRRSFWRRAQQTTARLPVAMLTFHQNLLNPLSHNLSKTLNPPSTYPLSFSFPKGLCLPKPSFPTLVASSTSRSRSTATPNPNPKSPNSTRNRKKKAKSVVGGDGNAMDLPIGKNGNDTILLQSEQISDINPQQPKGGKKSEAQATKDAIFNQFEETLASIRAENIEFQDEMRDNILKESSEDSPSDCNGSEESEDEEWPLDEDVGWGVQASDYFEKHPIRNVVDNGVEIDWEGELDECWVKEINCLEWESFAFHPSPLVLLVFERYKRPSDNWRCLKELEKAAKVYWSCRDRLPPRTVKIDVNIETDLAHALRVKESDCPQLLFLRGNRILYREKVIRDADELVKMIAHFYYKAKRPEWVDPSSAVA